MLNVQTKKIIKIRSTIGDFWYQLKVAFIFIEHGISPS